MATLPAPAPTAPLILILVVAAAFGTSALTSTLSKLVGPSGTALDAFTSEFLPTQALGAVRLCFSLLVLYVIIMAVTDKPVTVKLVYLPGSSMVARGGPPTLTISGAARLTSFTMQTFTLLGVYFWLVAVASFSWPLLTPGGAARVSIVLASLWNVVYPCSLLVSFITTWVLIPTALKKGTAAVFAMPTALYAHNANMVMVATELAISRQVVSVELLGAAILWGCWYLLFTWTWCLPRWRMVFYFFLDPTLATRKAVAFHLALLLALSMFAALGALISHLSEGQPLLPRLGIALLVCFCTTRVRVYRGEYAPPPAVSL